MKLFKWGCLGIIILVILVATISMCSSSGSNKQTGNKPGTTTKPIEPAKPAEPGRAEYDKIVIGDSLTGKGGMTKNQVNAILGKPINTTESQSGNMKMEICSYSAKGSLGANIGVTFINGLASNKTQTGIE